MPDVSNSSGSLSGSQKIGAITVNLGNRSVSKHQSDLAVSNAGHDGDFHGQSTISITGMSEKYDSRFDDVGYYP